MTLPVSGPISLLNIQTEFGGSNPISINEYYRDGAYVTSNNTSVPTTGMISFFDFYGGKKGLIIPSGDANFYSGTYTVTNLSDGSSYVSFLTSGTLNLNNVTATAGGIVVTELLLVGGGGGSGNDGGGGGGGVAFSTTSRSLSGSYSISIGAGGAVGIFSANRGGDTTAFGFTAVGSPSCQFNANNNNGANGSGTVDSTVCSGYGNAPTGQPAITNFTVYGGNRGGNHGCGRGSGPGGGATQAGPDSTGSPGGNGVQITVGTVANWYAVGGRSSAFGGGTNNPNWVAANNTGNGGTSNTNGYSGVVRIRATAP